MPTILEELKLEKHLRFYNTLVFEEESFIKSKVKL